jgi:hypothetical protein
MQRKIDGGKLAPVRNPSKQTAISLDSNFRGRNRVIDSRMRVALPRGWQKLADHHVWLRRANSVIEYSTRAKFTKVPLLLNN